MFLKLFVSDSNFILPMFIIEISNIKIALITNFFLKINCRLIFGSLQIINVY